VVVETYETGCSASEAGGHRALPGIASFHSAMAKGIEMRGNFVRLQPAMTATLHFHVRIQKLLHRVFCKRGGKLGEPFHQIVLAFDPVSLGDVLTGVVSQPNFPALVLPR